MKNFRKSRKALSPVVASIILIAVTVAVSIAVAAWMGALTVGFMATEELRITGMSFSGSDVIISVTNQGTSGVTINEVYINGQKYTATFAPSSTVGANAQATVTVSSFTSIVGGSYQARLITAKGNQFMYTAVA
jgi:flagellin-like protein